MGERGDGLGKEIVGRLVLHRTLRHHLIVSYAGNPEYFSDLQSSTLMFYLRITKDYQRRQIMLKSGPVHLLS